MTTSSLNTTRKNNLVSGSDVSEVELIATREEFAEHFNEMIALRKLINGEKVQACLDIDAKYQERLQEMEASYALMLSLVA